MSSTTVALRLDVETQDRLKALSQNRARSPHYLMKEAVARYLAEEEALEAEKTLMRERWERYQLTGEALPHDEVAAYFDTLMVNAY